MLAVPLLAISSLFLYVKVNTANQEQKLDGFGSLFGDCTPQARAFLASRQSSSWFVLWHIFVINERGAHASASGG
jgi:hypothetical protein